MRDPRFGRKELGRWASRSHGGRRARWSGAAGLPARCEQLEQRQLLTTVFAVTDNNVLLRFDSQTPHVIERSVPITGLPSNERIAAIEFKPGAAGSTPTLFGVASGNRTPFYTIDPATGVATRFSSGLAGSFPTSFAVGFAYDDLNNQFRYTDELGGAYRFNDQLNDFTNTAGIGGLTDVAFRATGGDASLFRFIGVRYDTDQLVEINPANGAVESAGTLGVDVEKWVGLDIAPDGTPLLSVRVGGVTRFGTVNSSDGHTFAELGTIGDGSMIVRGLTVDPTPPAAPVLNTALTVNFGSILEDSLGGEGVTVSALIAGASGVLITDPNPGAQQGLAITGAAQSDGQWQYSLGGAWQSLGQVSEDSALLLPADGAARLRFIPALNFNGVIAQALTFRAWDQTGAGAGDRVAIGPGGGESGFSAETSFASLTVLPTPDRPSIDRGAAAVIQISDKQTAAPFSGFTIDYVDDASQVLTTTVWFDPERGALTPQSLGASGFVAVEPGVFRFVGTAAAATTAARLLVFKPAENTAPVGQQTLAFLFINVDDQLVGPAEAISPFIAVLSVNDAPAVSVPGSPPLSITDRQSVRPFAGATVTDADVPAQNLTARVTIPGGAGAFTPESIAASGFAADGPSSIMFVGKATAVSAALDALVFRPTSGASAPGTTVTINLGLTVTDGLGEPVVASVPTIHVLAVEDEPVLTGLDASPFSITDKQTVTVFLHLTITDDDSPTRPLTVTITIPAGVGSFTPESLAASGFAALDETTFRFVGAAAAATAAARRLVFKPTENAAAPGTVTPAMIGISVDDGIHAPAVGSTAVIEITSENDAPRASGFILSSRILANKSVKPFRRVAIADADAGDVLTAIVRLSKPAKGEFTPASLRNSGFVKFANGRYRFVGTAAQAQAAVRKLVFKFTPAVAGQPTSLKAILTVTDASGARLNNAQTGISLRL